MLAEAENVAPALTTVEHWFGEGVESFALVTVGAGIGCGLVAEAGNAIGCGIAAVRPLPFEEWERGAFVAS